MALSMYYKTNNFTSSNVSKTNIINPPQNTVATFTFFCVVFTQLADPLFRNTDYTPSHTNL